MKFREAAKAWVGGVGAAITAYAGTWTDDVRVLGLFAVITSIATYMVPNSGALPPPYVVKDSGHAAVGGLVSVVVAIILIIVLLRLV